jgi:hypothetical protein
MAPVEMNEETSSGGKSTVGFFKMQCWINPRFPSLLMARQESKNRPSIGTALVTRTLHAKAVVTCVWREKRFAYHGVIFFPHLLYLLKINTKILNAATCEVRWVIRFLNANNFRPAEINEQIVVVCVVKV